MRETFRLLLALVAGLVLSASASADTLITNFDSYVPNSLYGAWGDGNVTTITSGPTSYDVESLDFGGAYKDIIPNPDGTGETTVELDASVIATSLGNLGFVIALGDTDLTEWNYRWLGVTAGNHILTLPIDTPTFISNNGGNSVLDLDALDYIHIQVDPGGANSYSVSFNNLRLTGAVPEPASITLVVCGVAGLLVLRRRYR